MYCITLHTSYIDSNYHYERVQLKSYRQELANSILNNREATCELHVILCSMTQYVVRQAICKWTELTAYYS